MSFLVANLPTTHCYVRKEYLYDLRDDKGVGELEECYWVSVRAVPGMAFYIEAFIPKYGALFDKLPLSAFVWKKDIKREELLPLDTLQIWNCFNWDMKVIVKEFVCGMRCRVYCKDRQYRHGTYLFTIDMCHARTDEVDTTLVHYQPEHKTFNFIELDNGQYVAQPNNRIQFMDQSLCPRDLELPDFHVCTRDYTCEEGDKWTFGDTDKWQYKAKGEGE
tara:strand:+ start:82 stop:738 length:657 start_codon:yes stop_codon:yes gene_type:complete